MFQKRKLLLTLSSFILLISYSSVSMLTRAASLESLNKSDQTSVYDHTEKALGKHWLRSFRGQVKTLQSPVIIEYLKSITTTLLEQNSHNFKGLSLVVVDNPEVNAFAVPGGVIGMNLGIFLSATKEGELASILAHELAHLSQRHYSRSKQEASNQKLSLYAGILLSITLAATGSADGANAVLASSQALAIHQKLRFSRQFEQEADRVGLNNLVASGYDKSDMLTMLETLDTRFGNSKLNSKPPEYLLTHPYPTSRIIELKQLQLTQQKKSTSANSLSFELLKTMAEVYYQSSTSVSLKEYQHRINTFKKQQKFKKLEAAKLGYALLLKKKGDNNKAIALLKELIVKNPNEPILHTQHIEALLENDQADQAFKHLQKYTSFKHSYPMNVATIETLMHLKRYKQAQQKLFQLLKNYSDEPLVWHLLSETSGKMGDSIQHHESKAELLVLYGRFNEARIQLNFALSNKALTKGSGKEKALRNRLAWIDEQEKEKKKFGL